MTDHDRPRHEEREEVQQQDMPLEASLKLFIFCGVPQGCLQLLKTRLLTFSKSSSGLNLHNPTLSSLYTAAVKAVR